MKKLLFSLNRNDFEITFFSGTGAGGQHRNKHKNCVRIKHRNSGAISTGQKHRSKEDNQKEAFLKLIKMPKFKVWHSKKVMESEGTLDEIEKQLGQELSEDNLKVEIFKNGRWTHDNA